MHGGMFWTPSSSWQNFSPRQSFIDPAFSDDELAQGQFDVAPTPVPQEKKRPSFSNAANHAAMAAKAKMGLKLVSSSEADTAPAPKRQARGPRADAPPVPAARP